MKSKLGEIKPKSYGLFENTFFDVLDHQGPYVTKAMRTAIMKRSEFATQLKVEPTDFNKKAFKKEINLSNGFYKKERKKY